MPDPSTGNGSDLISQAEGAAFDTPPDFRVMELDEVPQRSAGPAAGYTAGGILVTISPFLVAVAGWIAARRTA